MVLPRFYLHVRNGEELVEDPEGDEFESIADARSKAIAAARELVAIRVRQGQGVDGQVIEIADATGRTLMIVPFKEAIQPD